MKYAKVLKSLVSQKDKKRTPKKQKEINNLLHSYMNVYVYTLKQTRYSQLV